MKKKVRFLLALALFALVLCVRPMPALAANASGLTLKTVGSYLYCYNANGRAQTGWKQIDGKWYYFRKKAEGRAPAGSALVGFQKMDGHTYYFTRKGIMQTGWRTLKNCRYYFSREGAAGEAGVMYTGLQKVNDRLYYFDSSGKMQTGWVTRGSRTYYFIKDASSAEYGAAVTGWKTLQGEKYYFSVNGIMQKNCWIKGKYYVDGEGHRLKSCVTPDGYVLDANGVKQWLANGLVKSNGKLYYYIKGKKQTGFQTINGKRYYFDEDGVGGNGWVTVDRRDYYLKNGKVQTGWQDIAGATYYFTATGKLARNMVIDGIRLGKDGAAVSDILLIAGHGQGDAGACATYGSTQYREEKFTRQFTKLIYQQLRKINPDLRVTMYDQNYNCYEVVAGHKQGPAPNFKNYRYVLEIHFNATAVSGKDLRGDGKYKGVGMYVNSRKKNTQIDKKIVSAVSKASGLPIWGRGTGIFTSSGLLNAKTCQGLGISYGLLETAFIDDKDDMVLYNKKKQEMAKAVASVLSSYFGS